MEWIAQLQGKVVGLDTAPLIYFNEASMHYAVGRTKTHAP